MSPNRNTVLYIYVCLSFQCFPIMIIYILINIQTCTWIFLLNFMCPYLPCHCIFLRMTLMAASFMHESVAVSVVFCPTFSLFVVFTVIEDCTLNILGHLSRLTSLTELAEPSQDCVPLTQTLILTTSSALSSLMPALGRNPKLFGKCLKPFMMWSPPKHPDPCLQCLHI